ncbi:MAG: twin-arginine translocation signal domain-containing protein, partial [Actinomycetota bacterium]|nr:twin-arginine translocation signal domain-containing protein [Actinomycetota bacterium]
MAKMDKEGGGFMEVSRRDFMKLAATATAVGGGWTAFNPAVAAAYEGNSAYTIKTTTCPYCSASCGQRVVTKAGAVVD